MDYDQVQLGYCHIVAPISGKVGLRLVDPGNTIFSGTASTLVVITQLQPITVVFNVSEDDLPQVQAQLKGGRALTVDAFDRANDKQIESGKLTSLDNQVDTTTGTVKFRATFPNKNLSLFPNQFVNARLLLRTLRQVDSGSLRGGAAQRHGGICLYRPAEQYGDRAAGHDADEQRTGDGGAGRERGRQPGDERIRSARKWRSGNRPRAAQPDISGSQSAAREFGAMNPSRPFILRPVATALLMAALFLAGGVAYFQLPVSALPEVDYPTIQVLTFYPGASPDVVASAVTAPLERQFGQVAGLSQMTSTSAGGVSVIVMQFQLSLNIDVAEQEVQAAINAGQSYLPANLPDAADLQQVESGGRAGADAGVDVERNGAIAGRGSGGYAPGAEDLADLRRGAGEHFRRPEARRAHSGEPDGSGVLRDQSRRSAQRAHRQQPELGERKFRRTVAGLHHQRQRPVADAAAITNRSWSAYRNGAPVMLTQVAHVIDGVENAKLAAWMNYTPAVILNIQRQPGANTIQVVDSIEKLLPQLETTLPKAVHVQIVTDRTTAIRASVKDVEFELMLTVGLVVMVIFLFLRSLSATIIPSIAVPLSLVGTFARDVSGGLQPEQSDDDGADDLHGICRGRRDRHDREYFPLYRGGREAAGGGA